MISSIVLRQIVRDSDSLNEYEQGIVPSYSAIKRRLWLLERLTDTELPDHYYLNASQYTLRNANSLWELLSLGLVRLAGNHLEIISDTVYVKNELFTAWQELLTLCPPLVLVSSFLWENRFIHEQRDPSDLLRFLNNFIIPNLRYTAYPPPYMPQMEAFLKTSGFIDLHIHLNGSTETDKVWQYFLRYPHETSKEFEQSLHRPKVLEQINQEEFAITPIRLYRRLMTAQLLRRLLVNRIFEGRYTPEIKDISKDIENLRNLAGSVYAGNWDISSDFRHPLRKLYKHGTVICEDDEVCLEALLYVLVIDELHRTHDDSLARLFHQYLLTLGFVNRFLVHNIKQRGFDQFQKFTMNGFRNKAEEKYSKRFFQLDGNRLNNYDAIEARFSPKNSPAENRKLIIEILKGWNRFSRYCEKELREKETIVDSLYRNSNDENNSFNAASNYGDLQRNGSMHKYARGRKAPAITLVSHFIKRADDPVPSEAESYKLQIRHRNLRLENWTKANALAAVIKEFKGVLTGIDAAASELETPAEVFAPAFRLLRRRGMENVTYHAGEDFHHLVGGLRAVYEALEFLDLKRGDRIGHATAAGIDPSLWLNSVGKTLYIKRGEWLDDLIFAYHLISSDPETPLHRLLFELQSVILALGERIYGNNYSVDSYVQAWRMRKHCPIHMLTDFETLQSHYVFSREEWDNIPKMPVSDHSKLLLRKYHTVSFRKKYDEMSRVEVDFPFRSAEMLQMLQEIVLKKLHKSEVILESLPTSNTRISFYKSYKDHHLWRWLEINKSSKLNCYIPPVVLGTDDAGIFATNIYNEYCHVFNYLVTGAGMSHNEAMEIIKKLHENSKVYRFHPSGD